MDTPLKGSAKSWRATFLDHWAFDHNEVGEFAHWKSATILPGICIGEGVMVTSGSDVTTELPPWGLSLDVRAGTQPLLNELRQPNRAKRW